MANCTIFDNLTREVRKMKGLVIFVCFCMTSFIKCQDVVTIVEIDPIPEGDVIILNSTGYPGNDLYVLWKFSHDIDVKVRKLKVDGQRGDFLLLSKQPFPILAPESENYPIDDVLEKLPIDESVVLSWVLEEGEELRLLNNAGVTIFFHGQQSTVDLEIELEVRRFVRKPEETPTTTEPAPTIPPGQTEEDYVTKFLVGKVPNQFLLELDHFKSVLANMTDKYTDEQGIQRPNLTNVSGIHVPLDELRFCSRSWPTFKECVEVTFAIVTYDYSGGYVMTGVRIHEMWDMYGQDLIGNGYTPYIPPKAAGRTVGWVWVAVCLGSVILVSVLLCLTWLKKATDELNRDAEMSRAMTQMTDEEKFYDRDNPVHQIRKTMVNGRLGKGDNYEYLQGQGSWEKGIKSQAVTGGYYLPSLDGSDSSDIFRVNNLYVPDEDEEEEYFSKPNSNSSAKSDHHQQEFRARLHPQTNFGFGFDEEN